MTRVAPLAPPWREADAVGWYRTICTLCNAMALPVEGWMRPWPASAP